MKKVIKPGRARKSINFIDNIVYSRQKDLEGNEMELKNVHHAAERKQRDASGIRT